MIGAKEWRDRGFMYEANLDALLTYAASKTTLIEISVPHLFIEVFISPLLHMLKNGNEALSQIG